MGQPARKNKPSRVLRRPSGNTAFRRVIRQDGSLVCGICRTHYQSNSDAYNCLSQCWHDFINSEPVIPRPHYGRDEFRCKLCARDYDTYNEAEECFEICKGQAGLRIASEIKLSQVDITASFVRSKRSFKRPKLVLAQIKTESSVSDDHQTAPTDQVESNDSQASDQDKAPASPPKKKKPAKSWLRVGAEYVCTICQTHYYTKVETIACFDGHDESEYPDE